MTKHLNTNKQFMIGNGMLAVAVLFVVVLFVYVSLRFDNKGKEHFSEVYTIVLEEGFNPGDLTEIHLNDSIIFNEKIENIPTRIEVERFAKQSALLFVDQETQAIQVFNLDEKGGAYHFEKLENKINIIPKD